MKRKRKLSDPGFRLALRYQLRWLILTLQASSEKANRKALAADAQEIVDAMFRDADKLAGQEQELGQAVTSTVFARAYEIGHLENEKWPLSPVQLDEIYGTVVFPPLRSPTRVDANCARRGSSASNRKASKSKHGRATPGPTPRQRQGQE